jgi:hypothetical protein
VVITIIAMLIAIAIPASRSIKASYESTGAESMISSALASARAIAAKEHCYAGVRFQKAWQLDNDGPQYMIFIVKDPTVIDASGKPVPASGFRAVDGLKPIKLPDNMGVTDLTCSAGTNASTWGCWTIPWADAVNPAISPEFCDATTFSIVFSPTGKLIIHYVQAVRKDTYDDIFNDVAVIANGNAMFQDDYYNSGSFQKEFSRSSFVIFDKDKLKNAKDSLGNPNRWFGYLAKLPVIHINQYTGTMIEK